MPLPARDLRRTDWLICLLLAALAAKVYGEIFHHDFIRFDTPRYVTKNPHVLAGLTWDGVGWAFTTFFKSNWHPLTWLSHMVDVSLFGVAPGAHHATNLLLHAINAGLLYAVLRRATGAVGASAFVALVFAVHPTHVESVAWVAERKDVLSQLFGLLALSAYLGYAREGGARRMAWVVLWTLCGLASKAMLVTLPFLLLLLDYWPLGRLRFDASARRILLEKVPLFAAVFAVAAVTYFAQHQSGAVALGDPVTFPQRLANAAVSYVLYIGKTFRPVDLALVYPHPNLPGGTPWQAWQVAASCAVLVGVTALVLAARRRPYLAVGWLWYLGTLVPVIGIVQTGTQGFADRYTYLPTIGLSIMVAWGARDFARSFGTASRAALVGAAALAVVALALTAQRQVSHWRSTIVLFEHSLAIEPGATMLRNNLANELFERGFVSESIEHYRILIDIDPDSSLAHRNLSNALQKQGNLYAATRHAILGRDEDIDSYEAQLRLGDIARRQGETVTAEVHFRRAVALDPDAADARRLLGYTLLQRGRYAEAIGVFRALVEDPSRTSEDFVVLGQVLRIEGELDSAIDAFERAVAGAPDSARTHTALADALLARGDRAQAVAHYRTALGLAPDDPDLPQRLERALGD